MAPGFQPLFEPRKTSVIGQMSSVTSASSADDLGCAGFLGGGNLRCATAPHVAPSARRLYRRRLGGTCASERASEPLAVQPRAAGATTAVEDDALKTLLRDRPKIGDVDDGRRIDARHGRVFSPRPRHCRYGCTSVTSDVSLFVMAAIAQMRRLAVRGRIRSRIGVASGAVSMATCA